MHINIICLTQLLQLLQKCKTIEVNDLVLYHLYNIRNNVSTNELRSWFIRFVRLGFNPFSKNMDDASYVMFKSIRKILDNEK